MSKNWYEKGWNYQIKIPVSVILKPQQQAQMSCKDRSMKIFTLGRYIMSLIHSLRTRSEKSDFSMLVCLRAKKLSVLMLC